MKGYSKARAKSINAGKRIQYYTTSRKGIIL